MTMLRCVIDTRTMQIPLLQSYLISRPWRTLSVCYAKFTRKKRCRLFQRAATLEADLALSVKLEITAHATALEKLYNCSTIAGRLQIVQFGRWEISKALL